jgi:hypothetical protein
VGRRRNEHIREPIRREKGGGRDRGGELDVPWEDRIRDSQKARGRRGEKPRKRR